MRILWADLATARRDLIDSKALDHEKVRQLKKQQQERAERRFNRETTYQALTDPHFMATNHTRQDR